MVKAKDINKNTKLFIDFRENQPEDLDNHYKMEAVFEDVLVKTPKGKRMKLKQLVEAEWDEK